MTSDRSILERQMADVDVRPFTLDEFHHRRRRKQRNRRIGTAVLGLVLAAAAIGGVLETIRSDRKTITSDAPSTSIRPPRPFVGTWESTDTDGSSQTMVIQPSGGGEYGLVIHDGAATGACAGAAATLTGAGRVETDGTLVMAMVLTCDDDSTPTPMLDPTVRAEFLAMLANMSLRYDPQDDELFDGNVAWRRTGTAPTVSTGDASPAFEGPSPFEGSWVVGREGLYFPDSLEIRLVGDGDLHEIVSLKAKTPQCARGPSTMTGTGRREVDRYQNPGLVLLSVTVRLTCDDGSTPVPQTAGEDIILNEFGISYTYDPVTDELVGSLGSLFIRQGAELAQGDPMATVDRMIDAVNARDADAFVYLFGAGGSFDLRGAFQDSGTFVDLVEAWMAINHAWDFEADVISCTADPAEPRLDYGAETDRWVDCEVASRWRKLSLEITERWRFELRGERMVYWQPEPLELDRSDRDLPLDHPGLEAWEAWLDANHPDDAARWLNEAQRTWAIDGHWFMPSDLIPYDPAFADDIEASIHEYLEEQ